MRGETPGTRGCTHLNNAGAALMPEPVLQAMRDHLELEAETGGYEAKALREGAIEGVYRELAALLRTARGQIALTEHATASFVAALSAIPFRAGDVLLTTRHDYVSNQIQYLSLARRMGIEVVRAPDGPEGGVDVAAMAELVHRRAPRLVAMSQIPTNSGLVQDVATVGEVCRERRTWFLVDACQSVGQMPVHPDFLGADFVSATARKFLRGPRGAGFLWVSNRVLEEGLEPLFPDLRGADWVGQDRYRPLSDARRFETWEFAYALILGMGEAARYARELGLDAIQSRAWRLAGRLRERLDELPGVRILDRGPELCAIVTASVRGWQPEALVSRLRRERIHTSSLDLGSGVIDFTEKGVEGALRVSPHYYNTEEEVDRFVDVMATLVRP